MQISSSNQTRCGGGAEQESDIIVSLSLYDTSYIIYPFLFPPMMTIDSLKIQAPYDVLKDWNTNIVWTKTNKERAGILVNDYDIYTPPDLGLKSIKLDHLKDQVTIEISAKILKDNYFDLINPNTIEQVVDEINKANVITVDKNKLIESAHCLTMDPCNNLKVSKPVNEYFPQLLGIRTNTKYKIDASTSKTNQGIVITGNQKSFKERVIAYHKLLEIKKDRALCKAVKWNLLEEQFEGILRIENNLVSKDKMREYSGIKTKGDVMLLDVLNSKEKPNHKLFKKVTSKFFDLSLFKKYEGQQLKHLEKRMGRERIIEKCNYDMEAVSALIKSLVKGNVSHYLRDYRRVLFDLQRESNMIIEPKENEYVLELMELLAVA